MPPLPALFAVLSILAALARAEDLAKRYPATKAHSESGLTWNCDAGDVWQLKSFAFEQGKDFALSTGKATVAIGAHEKNALWAVVFPEKPAKLEAKGQPGDGETTRAILLRFAPADLGRIFPEKTVGANGDAWVRAQAGRIFRRKLGHKWFTPSGNPTIVPAGIVLVDVDTSAEKRRFYEVDRNNAKVTYVAEFETKTVPADAPLERKEAERIYDDVWSAFDKEYANFLSMPKLDWKKAGAEGRKLLPRVETGFELGAVLADVLAKLEDLHVWVKSGEDWLPGWSPDRPLNGSWKACEAKFGGLKEAGKELYWGRTKEGIGYVNVAGLGDASLPEQFDPVLEALADTWGLVIDLRFNGGGDELLARSIAGRFADQVVVYSKNQYRSGPEHDDLGPVLARTLEPRGPWRYQSPVVVLWGRRVMSSAESLALMLAQCPQVVTMGDRTAGASANPRRLEPGAGLTINLPRWRDLDPDGRPIEHVGIEPDVKLDVPAKDFTDAKDPVLDAALARLAADVPPGKRAPGKR